METGHLISDTLNSDREIEKSAYFPNKVLIINGWGGSGKTCICNVFKAIKGIENMRYSTEIELIAHLWLSENIDLNSAKTLIATLSDYIIYNLFQSREINFRPSDLSSIFNSPIWYKYIFRLFSKGGEDCVKHITKKTILNLVTHNLFQCNSLLKASLGEKLIFVEVARDPLYMLSQLKYNQDTIYTKRSPRNFTLNYKATGRPIPDGLSSLDDRNSDNWERAMNYLEKRMEIYFDSTSKISYQSKESPFFIFFEDFVKNPEPFIKHFSYLYGLEFNKKLNSYLKKEKIPRLHHSFGRDTKIYRKVGWQRLDLSTKSMSEFDSYMYHYKSQGVTDKIISRLVKLSDKYKSWKSTITTEIHI